MSITGNFFQISSIQNHFQILEMDSLFFPRPWKRNDWEGIDWSRYMLYAWRNEEIEAFALFHRVENDETAHLLKICLKPALRGKGLSQEFWNNISCELKEKGVLSVYLEVEKSNLRAQEFYFKVGFKVLREIKGYYSDGEAGVVMNLTL